MKAVVRVKLHRHGLAARRTHHCFIGGVIRIKQDHFIARLNDGHKGNCQCCLCSGQEQELILADGPARLPGIKLRQHFKKAMFCGSAGIARAPGLHLPGCHIQNGRCWRQVGLANGKKNHLLTSGAALFAFHVNGPFV